jgi:hypothetical protein
MLSGTRVHTVIYNVYIGVGVSSAHLITLSVTGGTCRVAIIIISFFDQNLGHSVDGDAHSIMAYYKNDKGSP